MNVRRSVEVLRRLAATFGLVRTPSEQRIEAPAPTERFRKLAPEQVERVGAAGYAELGGSQVTCTLPEAPQLRAHALSRIFDLPEGSLYAAGALVFFDDREVLEAAAVLEANGISCADLESRAAIIRQARNDHPDSFHGDDLAGYYEDFPM